MMHYDELETRQLIEQIYEQIAAECYLSAFAGCVLWIKRHERPQGRSKIHLVTTGDPAPHYISNYNEVAPVLLALRKAQRYLERGDYFKALTSLKSLLDRWSYDDSKSGTPVIAEC